MNLSDNKYFKDIMSKYFLILIEMNFYVYRQNSIQLSRQNDDKPAGIFNAMREISDDGFSVVCVNFDNQYPVLHHPNLHFIEPSSIYNSYIPCDFLFVYGTLENGVLSNLCNYYNPKFIFNC